LFDNFAGKAYTCGAEMGLELDEKLFFSFLEVLFQNSFNFLITSYGSKFSHQIFLGLLHKENQKANKPFHQPPNLT
jgi:hypothetical protein